MCCRWPASNIGKLLNAFLPSWMDVIFVMEPYNFSCNTFKHSLIICVAHQQRWPFIELQCTHWATSGTLCIWLSIHAESQCRLSRVWNNNYYYTKMCQIWHRMGHQKWAIFWYNIWTYNVPGWPHRSSTIPAPQHMLIYKYMYCMQ